jgi:hypothetical protein
MTSPGSGNPGTSSQPDVVRAVDDVVGHCDLCFDAGLAEHYAK